MNVPADDRDEFERLLDELASLTDKSPDDLSSVADWLRFREFAVKIYYLGHERGMEMAETYYSEAYSD